MWLSDILVTLKAGNGSENFPKAFGAPDRKKCLWALLAGCSLLYSVFPLEVFLPASYQIVCCNACAYTLYYLKKTPNYVEWPS